MIFFKENLLSLFVFILTMGFLLGWYILGILLEVKFYFLIISLLFVSASMYFLYVKIIDLIWEQEK